MEGRRREQIGGEEKGETGDYFEHMLFGNIVKSLNETSSEYILDLKNWEKEL